MISIEKNPESFAFLQENLRLNGVERRVEAVCGDNRLVADEMLGQADRVSMGYIPTPVQFIGRAVAFLNAQRGGIVHYHFVAAVDERDSLPLDHFQSQLDSDRFSWQILACRQVKSFAPHLFHYVSDIRVQPKK